MSGPKHGDLIGIMGMPNATLINNREDAPPINPALDMLAKLTIEQSRVKVTQIVAGSDRLFALWSDGVIMQWDGIAWETLPIARATP